VSAAPELERWANRFCVIADGAAASRRRHIEPTGVLLVQWRCRLKTTATRGFMAKRWHV
jgi:hypothetical protein